MGKSLIGIMRKMLASMMFVAFCLLLRDAQAFFRSAVPAVDLLMYMCAEILCVLFCLAGMFLEDLK